jgi:hypothetical protein
VAVAEASALPLPAFVCRVVVKIPELMAADNEVVICEYPSAAVRYCCLSTSNETEYLTCVVDSKLCLLCPLRVVSLRFRSVTALIDTLNVTLRVGVDTSEAFTV